MLKAISRTYILAMVLVAVLSVTAFGAQKDARQKAGAEQITINFIDVEITSLAKIMSEITGKNIIYDSDIKGSVTIIAPAKLTRDEAFSLFISALELKNFTIIPVDNGYKIIPLSQARQSGTRLVKKPEGIRADDTFIVRLIPLKYISVQEALPFVQPFISRNGYMTAFGSRNALIIADSVLNIDKIVGILTNLDTKPELDEPEIIYLKYAQSDTITTILRQEAVKRLGKAPSDTNGVESRIVPDKRLNAVILSGPPEEREYLRRFITLVDVMPPEATSRINLYYLENADAAELAKVLDALITQEGPKAAPPGVSATLTQEITGRVTITPHPPTNSLIVMASPTDYQSLKQVILKLDRRPKQVFVEAMMTEVSIDDALELGTKWRITGEKGGEPVAIGGVGTVDQSALQSILNGITGLSIGGIGNFVTVPVTRPDGTTFNLTAPGFAALFSVTELKDVVNVLSTPHILTSDNTEAEIIVAENVPFLSSLERESSTTGQPLLQSIERKDVGIILRIKPKISEGNYVKLDIYQEISAIAPTQASGASDLITTKRSARTNVVVKDNQTVVIGGLIQDRLLKNETKVPLLGDIPILGWLFRFHSSRKIKTNLLVFITPHVVHDFQGLDKIRQRKEKEYLERGGVLEDREKPAKKDPS